MRCCICCAAACRSGWCHWVFRQKDCVAFSYCWRDDGTWQKINYYLIQDARIAQGRDSSPSAGVYDSQSVKTTESGGVCGHDAVKKVKGQKCHIITDTNGFLIYEIVHTADIQERNGAPMGLWGIRIAFNGCPHLCLRWLCRWWTQNCTNKYRWLDHRNNQTVRPRKGFHCTAPPLGCWVHLRVAKPLPPPCQRLQNSIESTIIWLFMTSIQLLAGRRARTWYQIQYSWFELLVSNYVTHCFPTCYFFKYGMLLLGARFL